MEPGSVISEPQYKRPDDRNDMVIIDSSSPVTPVIDSGCFHYLDI